MQQGFDGAQGLQALVFGQCFQLFERDGITHMQAAGFHAAQHGQVTTAAQGIADIFAQGADVSAFAATHAQMQLWRIAIKLHAQQFQIVDDDLARRALYRFAITRVFVKRLAVFF